MADTTRRTPLLLLLDGILSQDERQTRLAMTQIYQLVPDLKQDRRLASIEEDDGSDVLTPLRSAELLTRVIHCLMEAFPNLASVPSAHDMSLPLHFAASIGNVSVARLLLENYPQAASQPNTKGKIPLHYAAREGRTNMVVYLLQAMPQTAAIESKKRKLALHFAAGEGHVDVVRALLRVHPAGASLTSGKGKMPLHFAARWGHLQVAQDLCSIHPASCSSLDWEGSLPLHDAARQGQVEMAKFLVMRHPEGLSTANIRGEIPLFPAVRSGSLDLVVFLLKSWPRGGKHILKNIRQTDNVEDWDPSILDLCLRGAVENFFDCDLIKQSEAPLSSGITQYKLPPARTIESSAESALSPGKPPYPMGAASHPQTNTACNRPLTPPTLDITLPRSKSPILEGLGSRKKRCASSSLEGECTKRACAEGIAPGAESEDSTPRSSFLRPFIPLHAALECGATCHVVRCVLERHEEQVRQPDGLRRLPLHVAVSNCRDTCCNSGRCGAVPRDDTDDVGINNFDELVLDRMLKPFPEAAAMRDVFGHLPLHAALASRASCRVIQDLLVAHPSSGVKPCRVMGPPQFVNALPIFMATEYDCDLSTVYTLLRGDPGVIKSTTG